MINQGLGVGRGNAARGTTSTSRGNLSKSGFFRPSNSIIASPLLVPVDLV